MVDGGSERGRGSGMRDVIGYLEVCCDSTFANVCLDCITCVIS